MAWAAGANRVFAIERDKVAELATAIMRENRCSEVVTVLGDDAARVELPEPVDVLVSECIGSGGLGTTQIGAVLETRKRCVRPGGIVIPKSTTVVMAPVESVLTELYLKFWRSRPGGFAYDPAEIWARDQMYTVVLRPEELMGPPQDLFTLRYDLAEEYHGFSIEHTVPLTRRGTVHGIGVWFRCQLTDEVALDTSPGEPLTHWYQCYLPLREGIRVDAGDSLVVSVGHRYCSEESVWDWTVRSNSASTKPGRQTTLMSVSKMSAGTAGRPESENTGVGVVASLLETIRQRVDGEATSSYTRWLLDGGVDRYGAKVLEEANELVRAASAEGRDRTVEEAADLVYHLFVLLRGQGIELEDVTNELGRRRR